MKAGSLTPLLVRARQAGLKLGVEGDALIVSPRARLTPELREELTRHDP